MNRVIETIRQLYLRHGQNHYGEAVSQADHAIQGAVLARDAGDDDEMILAAFLHDIGHLLEQDGIEPMGPYGQQAHDRLGADYLQACGFSPRVVRLVGQHVAAKRFLCRVRPAYRAALSPASEATLHFQGGPMTAEEATAYARHADLDDILRLRELDEAAKDAGWQLDQVDWLWLRMDRHLAD